MFRLLWIAMAAGAIALVVSPIGLAGERPNVVVILADDLGFSDLGCYGGEIETPHLDRLARGGLRFTRFYNTARCWPTRAALLTGYYAQQVGRDVLPGQHRQGRGTRPDWARLLPEMLRPLGYRSYHSGKWHVDGMPCAGGFDRSYWLEDAGRYFHPRVHYLDDEKLPPVAPGTGYYSTVAIAEHAIAFLKEHEERHAGEPFFQYVAFTAPHFPLHALPEDIARYRDRYREGWEVVRRRRWQRLVELGIAPGSLSAVEREVGPPHRSGPSMAALGPVEVDRPVPWEELTEQQREFQAVKMAIHAAMVDRMDREVGRILKQLEAMGAMENTLIFFLSDNGASAEILVRDDGHDRSAPPGSAATHLCLGPGWSTVSNTPFRRHKTWVHEGGIATPLIVHWPRGFAARNELRHNVGHVIDLAPTILDAAGGRAPVEWNGRPVPTPPGESLLPVLARDHSVEHECLWWCHSGNRAIRMGDWKLVSAGSCGPWELYDMGRDGTETTNLAGAQPERVHAMKRAWTEHAEAFRAQAGLDAPAEKPQ